MDSQKQLNYDLAMAYAAARLTRRSAEELLEQAEREDIPLEEVELEMLREDFFYAYEYYRAQLPRDGVTFPLK